jgi:hypothetical protein
MSRPQGDPELRSNITACFDSLAKSGTGVDQIHEETVIHVFFKEGNVFARKQHIELDQFSLIYQREMKSGNTHSQ